MFTATLVLGAGVFVLPAEAARSGALITLGLLVAALPATAFGLRRLVDAVNPAVSGATSAAFGSAVAACGAGAVGRRLAGVGVAAYVLPATVGYASIGAPLIVDLAVQISSPTAALGVAIVGTLAAKGGIELLQAGLGAKLVRCGGIWAIGVAICSLATTVVGESGLTSTVGIGISAATFAASALAATTERVHSTDEPGALRSAHVVSIMGLGLQALLMTVLAVGTALTILFTDAALATPVWVGDPTPTSLLTTAGVLAFALVGTGHFCLFSYPAMKDRQFRRRTVDLGLRIVVIVEAMWIAVVVFTIDASTLIDADMNSETSAQAMAAVIGSHTLFATAATVIAAVTILIGVTGAALGFAESLALETPGVSTTAGRTRFIVIAASAIAGLVESLDLPVSIVLGVAGTVGGAMLLVVLPALCEQSNELFRKRRAGAIAVVGSLAGVAGAFVLISAEQASIWIKAITGSVLIGTVVVTTAAAKNLARS